MYNTTAHEFCHLAVWAVDNSKTDHHGPLFKRWGALVGRKFSDLGITVTRCHSYEIEYKYHLSCQTEHCSYVWKQQSKPKDVGRMRCPRCRLGVLLQTKPVLRDPKPLTEYQTFTKQHMARIKRENPGSPLKEVMRMVGREWEAHKAGKTPLRASEGGSVAASGEWSDSDTQTRRHPLESMMDYLQVETLSNWFLGYGLTSTVRFDFSQWLKWFLYVFFRALLGVLFWFGYTIFFSFYIAKGSHLWLRSVVCIALGRPCFTRLDSV